MQRPGHYDGMSENNWKKDGMVKDGACKMDKIKKCNCARESGRRKNNFGIDEKIMAGPLPKKKLPAEGCSRMYDKWEDNSRQKKISDDR